MPTCLPSCRCSDKACPPHGLGQIRRHIVPAVLPPWAREPALEQVQKLVQQQLGKLRALSSAWADTATGPDGMGAGGQPTACGMWSEGKDKHSLQQDPLRGLTLLLRRRQSDRGQGGGRVRQSPCADEAVSGWATMRALLNATYHRRNAGAGAPAATPSQASPQIYPPTHLMTDLCLEMLTAPLAVHSSIV